MRQTVNQSMLWRGSRLPLIAPLKAANQEILLLNICGMDHHSTQPAPEDLIGVLCVKRDRKCDSGGRSRPRSSPQGPV